MEDEDALIQGDEEKGGDLDSVAVAEQEARTAERSEAEGNPEKALPRPRFRL